MEQRQQMIEWFAEQFDQRGIRFDEPHRMHDFDAPDNRACERLLVEADRRFRVRFNRPIAPIELTEALYSACFYQHRADRILRENSLLGRLRGWIGRG
ncbi:hypothetical protein [Saccharospirillum alexandrii]|uniref:hypothetical protein n=1 Tax=Saccharospirillum alexandrii TaxID=2448477 RepID=UPI000FDB2C1A|nr:hypothetical protein [Saccharospirillum alexandrii]